MPKHAIKPFTPTKRPNSYAGDLVGVTDNGLEGLFFISKSAPPLIPAPLAGTLPLSVPPGEDAESRARG